jgi:3-oxoadipate enol-lactonase
MAFAAIGKNVIHYITASASDKPALVFANSLGSDLHIWDDVAERLSAYFSIVRYDIRGHGLSEASPPPYSARDLSEDVVALMDLLEINQAILCGVSVGGIIAQSLVLDHPDRVRALVLSDTGARIGSLESWKQRIEIVQTGGLEALREPTMERWFSQSFRQQHTAAIRGYSTMLLKVTPAGYIGTCCALRDADFHATASRIKAPTLVLCGAEDIATPPELGRELAGLIAGSKFSSIDGSGHLPCIEQPGQMAERMMEFFQEVHIV